MNVTEISAGQFQEMVQAGATRLHTNAEYVNSLNVFPVPDGDTGTNMNLSMTSGAKAVADSRSEKVGELAGALSKGLLMGARGNSGVILSQLFRGFSKQIPEVTTLNAKDLAAAFTHGVETAYKAVMKPVEGTILTVSREAARSGERKAKETDDCIEVMTAVVAGAKRALAKTPDLLPVLKEVGVVDSGGQGLLFIYEGFLEALSGEFLPTETYEPSPAEMDEMVNAEHHRGVSGHVATEDIKFGYCTEIMVRIGEGPTVDSAFDYETFRNYLNELGDSLLVVNDDEIIKVHVHTEHPGEVMNYGQKFGSLVKIKVDNMRLQHETLVERDAQQEALTEKVRVPFAVIAIAAGEGVQELFRSLGASYIIKTISQGMTAMLAFNDQQSLEENKASMTEMLDSVVSGQVTTAVRDTTIDDVEIKKDDFLGMIDGKIVVSEADRFNASLDTLNRMIDEDTEIVTIIVGEDGSVEEAEKLIAILVSENDELETELHEGGQPVYPYLFSAE